MAKPHCAAAVQCGLFTHKSVPVIFEPPFIMQNVGPRNLRSFNSYR